MSRQPHNIHRSKLPSHLSEIHDATIGACSSQRSTLKSSESFQRNRRSLEKCANRLQFDPQPWQNSTQNYVHLLPQQIRCCRLSEEEETSHGWMLFHMHVIRSAFLNSSLEFFNSRSDESRPGKLPERDSTDPELQFQLCWGHFFFTYYLQRTNFNFTPLNVFYFVLIFYRKPTWRISYHCNFLWTQSS